MKENPIIAGTLRVLHLVFLMGMLSYLIISIAFSRDISRSLSGFDQYYAESVVVGSAVAVGALVAGNVLFAKVASDVDALEVDDRYSAYRKAMFNQFALANAAMLVMGTLYLIFNRGVFVAEALGIVGIQIVLFPTRRRLAKVLKLG